MKKRDREKSVQSVPEPVAAPEPEQDLPSFFPVQHGTQWLVVQSVEGRTHSVCLTVSPRYADQIADALNERGERFLDPTQPEDDGARAEVHSTIPGARSLTEAILQAELRCARCGVMQGIHVDSIGHPFEAQKQ